MLYQFNLYYILIFVLEFFRVLSLISIMKELDEMLIYKYTVDCILTHYSNKANAFA